MGNKKRLQEVNATIERVVELLLELYQEKSKLIERYNGESDFSVQRM
jgi:hypothetical protein